jgi:predicted Zn-dependent protease
MAASSRRCLTVDTDPMRCSPLIALLLCMTLAGPIPVGAQALAVTGALSAQGDALDGIPPASIDAHELPSLGDGSGGVLSPRNERKLGERVMREVRRDPAYLDDWLTRDYLHSVAAKLSAAARSQYIGGYVPDFELFVMRDPQINAFSMPGGFIGVNTGLFAGTRTESELASVVAHEMGHVLQRHIARMLVVNEHSGYTALAGMLFGVLAGVVAHSADLGVGIAMGGQALALDRQLRFSRAAEREADRIGFQMLQGAGYDPYAMPAFFKWMERITLNESVPAYARTHPLTGERIADMEDRARRTAYRQPRQAPEYGFARARLRVLQERSLSDYMDIARRLRTEIDDQMALNPAANWYGVAVAQMSGGRYAAARASLQQARAIFAGAQAGDAVVGGTPSSVSLDVLAAEIARRDGRTDEAVRIAQQARRRYPESHAVLDVELRALIDARRFAEAQAIARDQTRAEPERPEWWRYLAQASTALGDTAQQHRALAEGFALDGAWRSAIRQLREARDAKGTGFYDSSAIEARLHEFEARYREERDDDKVGNG